MTDKLFVTLLFSTVIIATGLCEDLSSSEGPIEASPRNVGSKPADETLASFITAFVAATKSARENLDILDRLEGVSRSDGETEEDHSKEPDAMESQITIVDSTAEKTTSAPLFISGGVNICQLYFDCSIRVETERQKCELIRAVEEKRRKEQLKSTLKAKLIDAINTYEVSLDQAKLCYHKIKQGFWSAAQAIRRPSLLAWKEREDFKSCLLASNATNCKYRLIQRLAYNVRLIVKGIEASTIAHNRSYTVCNSDNDNLANSCSQIRPCCEAANKCDEQFETNAIPNGFAEPISLTVKTNDDMEQLVSRCLTNADEPSTRKPLQRDFHRNDRKRYRKRNSRELKIVT